jgi:hypothetical protein
MSVREDKMSGKNIRSSKIDRRSTPVSNERKKTYTGPERRSGSERRIWIDRTGEIRSKLK